MQGEAGTSPIATLPDQLVDLFNISWHVLHRKTLFFPAIVEDRYMGSMAKSQRNPTETELPLRTCTARLPRGCLDLDVCTAN